MSYLTHKTDVKRTLFLLFSSPVLILLMVGALRSQDINNETTSTNENPTEYRSQILEGQRKAKADSLEAPHQGTIEKGMLFMETNKVIDRLRYGYYRFFLKFGGLSTRAKTALGFRYTHDELIRRSTLSWGVTLSRNRYQQYELGIDTQPFESIPLNLFINSRYRNFPEEEYFGLGPNSSLDDGTNFRIEDFTADIGAKVTVFSGLDVGVQTGHLKSRTAPGTSDDISSLEEIFTPDDAIGFSESVEHQVTGINVSLDLRDSPGNPRSGVSLFFKYRLYNEKHSEKYDFQTTSTEFQGYLPFFHKHRVFALRVLAMNTDGKNGGEAPFHFLPFIGGSRYIRGYREFRFRDNKAIMANLEYRFEAFIGCDVAIFGDVGQVQPYWEKFQISQFDHSYGAGLRFNTAESVFLRFDLGHGREGTRLYMKFDNVF